jgi:hypothetical protein
LRDNSVRVERVSGPVLSAPVLEPTGSTPPQRDQSMFRRLCACGRPKLLALALLALGAAPACTQAAWLGFRNDGNTAVIMQRACVVKGELRWGKARVLYPGEVSWDSIAKPGTKQIRVFDARKRPVYQGAKYCGDEDKFFSVRFVRPGQADLVPMKAPSSSKKK